MSTLARILPFNAISPGLLESRLEVARPDLMQWSRTEGSSNLPPSRLAQALKDAMPAAFPIRVEEMIAEAWRPPQCPPGKGLPAAVRLTSLAATNRPSIEILSPAGQVRWTIGLSVNLILSNAAADIRLAGDTLHLSAAPLAWDAQILFSLIATCAPDVPLATGLATIALPAQLQLYPPALMGNAEIAGENS